MTTNRKAHVIRIKDPSDPEAWVDVLRVDGFYAQRHAGAQGQYYHIRWDETADGTGNSNNPGRETETVTAEIQGAGGAHVDIPVVKKMVTNRAGQRSVWTFKNKNGTASTRQVRGVRVYHRDSLDPTTPIDWDTYKDSLAGVTDKSAYVDVEIPLRFLTKQQQGHDYQDSFRTMANKAVADLFEDPAGDTPAPVRLDPFQFIVNVSPGGAPFMAIGEGQTLPFQDRSPIFFSPDGKTWAECAAVFGAPGMYAVRGSDPTAYTTQTVGQPRQIAYGNGCFLISGQVQTNIGSDPLTGGTRVGRKALVMATRDNGATLQTVYLSSGDYEGPCDIWWNPELKLFFMYTLPETSSGAELYGSRQLSQSADGVAWTSSPLSVAEAFGNTFGAHGTSYTYNDPSSFPAPIVEPGVGGVDLSSAYVGMVFPNPSSFFTPQPRVMYGIAKATGKPTAVFVPFGNSEAYVWSGDRWEDMPSITTWTAVTLPVPPALPQPDRNYGAIDLNFRGGTFVLVGYANYTAADDSVDALPDPSFWWSDDGFTWNQSNPFRNVTIDGNSQYFLQFADTTKYSRLIAIAGGNSDNRKIFLPPGYTGPGSGT